MRRCDGRARIVGCPGQRNRSQGQLHSVGRRAAALPLCFRGLARTDITHRSLEANCARNGTMLRKARLDVEPPRRIVSVPVELPESEQHRLRGREGAILQRADARAACASRALSKCTPRRANGRVRYRRSVPDRAVARRRGGAVGHEPLIGAPDAHDLSPITSLPVAEPARPDKITASDRLTAPNCHPTRAVTPLDPPDR